MTKQEKVEAVVEAIIRDISDRSGLDAVWDGIDTKTKSEIFDRWASFVSDAIPDENTTSLRDTFAAAALGGLYPESRDDADAARRAYALADAMLKAREGT